MKAGSQPGLPLRARRSPTGNTWKKSLKSTGKDTGTPKMYRGQPTGEDMPFILPGSNSGKVSEGGSTTGSSTRKKKRGGAWQGLHPEPSFRSITRFDPGDLFLKNLDLCPGIRKFPSFLFDDLTGGVLHKVPVLQFFFHTVHESPGIFEF